MKKPKILRTTWMATFHTCLTVGPIRLFTSFYLRDLNPIICICKSQLSTHGIERLNYGKRDCYWSVIIYLCFRISSNLLRDRLVQSGWQYFLLLPPSSGYFAASLWTKILFERAADWKAATVLIQKNIFCVSSWKSGVLILTTVSCSYINDIPDSFLVYHWLKFRSTR